MLKSLRTLFNIISFGIAASMMTFFAVTFCLENPQLFKPTSEVVAGVVSVAAPAPAAPRGTAEQEALIASFASEAGYEALSPEYQATWDAVADVLYRKLGAYEQRFELSSNPDKNCAVKYYDLPGGCYQDGGIYDGMIFISPLGLSADGADFIAYHEYSHSLQYGGGDARRFSNDIECDADLRALELRGSWPAGAERQCLAAGYALDQLTVANLPQLEAQLRTS